MALAPATLPRRDFLARAGQIALAACGLGALAGSVRFAVPELERGGPRQFPLGVASDFKMRTLTWLREHDLFVARDDGGFGAFSSRCTHLGCAVQRTAEGFLCPCHGARYDPSGALLSGPARRNLPWYRLWLEPDGRIWVDLAQEVPVGTTTLSLPAGPALAEEPP